MRASIPSPAQAVWHLGWLPLRAYALCILLGIVLGVVVAERRWVARGGRPGMVADVVVWAVPFGIVGSRLYHVVTSPQAYFGAGGNPWEALMLWRGGLGIWGGVVGGALGAWIACRRAGVRFAPTADALAPGVVLAQAVGRWGNWFNNELYGRPSDLPWALRIHEWDADTGRAVVADGRPVVIGTFHPTFLYESLWCLAVFGVLLWADRRFRLGHGRVFLLYAALYTAGRAWIETLRVDPAEHLLGLRLNLWVSMVVFVLAVVALVVSGRRHPGREVSVLRRGDPAGDPAPSASR